MVATKQTNEIFSRSFRFNKRAVESLPAHISTSSSSEQEYSDLECRGLKVAVAKNGRKFLLHRYRIMRGSKSVRKCYRLGEFGPFTVQDGRNFVNENKRLIAQGIDPLEERQKASKVLSFQEFFESEYMPNYARKVKKSWRHDQWMYDSDLKNVFGQYLLSEISKREITKFIYSVKDRASGARANRFLSLISKVMSTALDWEFLDGENPCRRIKKFKESAGRTRYLDIEEIKRLKKALDSSSQRISALAIWFLLCTGARLGEAMSLTYDNLDLKNHIAYLPKEMTKNGTSRSLYLNNEAIKTLEELKRHKARGNPHIFAGTGSNGHGHLKSPRGTFITVKKLAKLENLRLHDLRHSFASLTMADSKNSLYTLSKLLGHQSQAMTMRYSHLTEKSLVDATESVAAQLEQATE